MSSVHFTVELPEGFSAEDARLLLAMKLFETGKATLGQAAKAAGLSKRAFIEVLGEYKVPVFNYSAEELREELDQ
jgi:predicted HTH domain antitoxin